jgi:uncharacterized membrane-anchored protein
MKSIHLPQINARYWLAITLASVFGTNLGDFYAHNSGLGMLQGVAVLAVVAALAFCIERFDRMTHEFYYWFVILVIRTGATNIADFLAHQYHMSRLTESIGIGAILLGLAWLSAARASSRKVDTSAGVLPAINSIYWATMLAAGVFGTAFGDFWEHLTGDDAAAVILSVALAVVFAVRKLRFAQTVAFYWFIIAVARSAGTAIGDWIAENQHSDIGLPLSTTLTGIAFLAVIVLWRTHRSQSESVAA